MLCYVSLRARAACFLTLALLLSAQCERLHEQIYTTIEGGSACFRRLNATHQAGCSSKDGGAIGVVHVIEGLLDANWIVSDGKAGPYVAFVNTELFNEAVEVLIEKPENVAGILVYDDEKYVPPNFSQESRCPNEYTSAAGSQCSASVSGGIMWNPHGTGLIRRDIPFPIFYLPSSQTKEIDEIYDCYKRFNMFDRDNQSGRPLCSLQLSSFMFAAGNTEICKRRSSISLNVGSYTKMCDPIGDRNIYSTLFPRHQTDNEPNRSVVLVTARIDSASLFDGIAPGAASSVVGLVTFLTAASTLSKMLPPDQKNLYQRNVLWALFSGESFDYVGSQRVAYDITQQKWPPQSPISPEKIDLHVELGQLGGDVSRGTEGQWSLSAFTPQNGDSSHINSFVDSISRYEAKLAIKKEVTNNVPPSSLHSFRRILGNSTSTGGLSEVVLVDHGSSFTNHFYQSVLDDKRNIGFKYCNQTVDESGTFIDTSTMIANGLLTQDSMQVKIANLATALAKALYERVTSLVYNGSEGASAHMVDELLYCYLESHNCRTFLAVEPGPPEGAGEPQPFEEPLSMYTGVFVSFTRIPLTTGFVLAMLTGQLNSTERVNCTISDDKAQEFYWFSGWNKTGVCIQTTMNYTVAISPAFTILDYDFASGLYSTWTESVWRGLWVRLFVAPSGAGARLANILGALVTLLAILVSYWLNKHKDTIFAQQATDSTVTINTDPTTTGILRTVNC